MLRWVLGFSLQYRALVLAGAAALMVLGAYRLRDAPIDALPEFSAPVIQIQTEALGLSASEIEDLVTLNLEEILASVAWLKTIRSKSMTGLSSILLVFEPGTDLMRARQLVQERLNLAHVLPNVSKPPVMLQPLVDDQPGDDHRAVTERRVADRRIGARALDDHAEAAGRARRGQCRRSGACVRGSCRCRSTRHALRDKGRNPQRRSSRPRATPCGCRR